MNPDIEFFFKYSYIGKTILMTLAFMNYFYYAPFISGIGLLSMYLIEKYNLTRNYRKPEQINGEITLQYLTIIKGGLVIFCGVAILLNKFYTDSGNMVLLILSVALVAFPYETLMRNLICFEDISTNSSFKDKYFSFGMNYEMINPVTKVTGYYKYLNRMMESGIITPKEKSEFLSGVGGEEVSNIVELYYSKIKSKKEVKQEHNQMIRSLSLLKQRNSIKSSNLTKYPAVQYN